jgi:hypothetical protein
MYPEKFSSFQVLKDILLNLKGAKPFKIVSHLILRRSHLIPRLSHLILRRSLVFLVNDLKFTCIS